MKIIKGGHSFGFDDGFEMDKKYAKILKQKIDDLFGKEVLLKDVNFIYEIARFCWNFTIISPLTDLRQEKYFKKILKEFNLDKYELKKFIQFTKIKSTELVEFNRMIKDFDIEIFGEGNYHVLIKTNTVDEFLLEADDALKDLDDQLEEEIDEFAQFEPNFVSRSLLIVKPKLTFVEHISKISGRTIRSSAIVMLIEEVMDEKDFKYSFNNVKEEIFVYIFESLYLETVGMPKKISFKLFKDWFDFEVITDVYDVCPEPIFKG
jgi:hypothetical protein